MLQEIYFKLRFSLCYRDVEELLSIKGINVDHATIQRWVFKFTPLVEQQFKKRKKSAGKRWRLDKAYFKVKCRIVLGLGFKNFESAKRTITGIQVI